MTIFNKKDNGAEININDEIGFWGVTHQDFTNQLNAFDGQDINLKIASYGGDVSHAFAIYNALKSHNGRVTANIYGDSASAATFIAMAADQINIVDNAMFLIHNVWGMTVGDADELRKQAEMMDKLNENIVDVYRKKTGLRKSQIRAFMDNEEWWTANEAKANGFVDKVVQPEAIINRGEAMLMNCANDKMKEALLEKVNKLNTNKNQFKMTEENKNWFQEQFDNVLNSFKKEEEPVVENVVETEETISKEEVSTMLNSVKEEVETFKNEAATKAAADAETIANLKAELEKANAKATTAKAENKNPEEEAKEEVATCSNIATLFANRMNKKFGSILTVKTK